MLILSESVILVRKQFCVKYVYLFLLLGGILMFAPARLRAQLPSGSIAPDFTAKDINGQYWNLYGLLAQNKIVILEISATWCPPCWAYHNTHTMQTLWELHGPQGDDRLRVLYVEGDPNTNLNCLYGAPGCNNSTMGNFVEGSTYPIFDDASIADLYEISYFPSIFIICPNKRLKSVGQLNHEDMWAAAQECPVAFGQHNAGIFEYSNTTPLHEICDTLHTYPHFLLTNLGANALTQAEIQLRWNDSTVQTIPWTGNLPLYGEAPVMYNSLPLHASGTIRAHIANINYGATDADLSNNSKESSFVLAPEFNSNTLLLRLRTDAFGHETYWEVRDEAGVVLEKGGNLKVGPNGGGILESHPDDPGAYGNNALIRDTLHLPGPGCYSFHIVDAYGDGICCDYGNGYYRLSPLSDPTNIVLSGGAFRAYEHRGFGTNEGVVSAHNLDNALPQVQVLPNPADARLQILITPGAAKAYRLRVYNALGQIMDNNSISLQTDDSAAHQLDLDTANWPAGVYFAELVTGNQRVSKSFVVQH